MENVRKMFPGEIVIIDDDIMIEDSDIFKIKNYLELNRFPVLTFEEIPDVKEISAYNIGFIICDWKFGAMDEQLNAENVIQFLNQITKDRLIPIFICTTMDKSTIEEYLMDKNGCAKYKNNEASCIFIVQKTEIMEDNIFKIINEWVDKNPSIKAMKAWERTIKIAKEKMFSQLYNENEYWPTIFYKSFVEDGNDPSNEMGQFISRNLLARAHNTYQFEEFSSTVLQNINLLKVLDGERTFYYDDTDISTDTILYTGDIFELEGCKYINIKRQCDLIRGNENIYLLTLKNAGKITDSPILVSEDKQAIKIFGKSYSFENKTTDDINIKINDAFSRTSALYKGKFLEKVSEVIIPCVCGYEVCKINLKSLTVIPIDTIQSNYKRIARLLEPYINIVTEKFASYISSKGTMRTPESLLTHKFICDSQVDNGSTEE